MFWKESRIIESETIMQIVLDCVMYIGRDRICYLFWDKVQYFLCCVHYVKVTFKDLWYCFHVFYGTKIMPLSFDNSWSPSKGGYEFGSQNMV